MKKLFLLILPAILLFAVSCGDDEKDKEENLTDHPIIGTWKATNIDYDIDTDNTLVTSAIKNYLENEAIFPENSTTTFQTNGIAVSEYAGEKEETKYAIKGSTLILKDDEIGDISTNYAINNNQLTIRLDMKPYLENISGYLGDYGNPEIPNFKVTKATITVLAERVK